VFLLDEPLSNLDAKLRAQIRADIARLQRRLNKTTLYVTHDQVEAMTLGDRVAVMNAGELQQLGTPDELYQQPQNTFVAKFIGSPGMNIIPSVLQRGGDGGFAIRLGGQMLELSRESSAAVASIVKHTDEKIHAGIRPEAITLSEQGPVAAVSVLIKDIEYLGHESLVYFSFSQADETDPDTIFIARVAGKPDHASGSIATFYIDPEAVYLFDSNGNVIA
jgi:ABC-type sugar transport system ATPase subunit